LKTVAWGWFALWKADKDQAHIDRVESRLKNDIIPTLVTPEDERGEPLEPVSFGNRPMESRYYKF
jgi:hypothetical protein